jgi:putative ABC transport system permease protein
MGSTTKYKDEFAEVEAFVRITGADDLLVRKGDIKFEEEHAAFADSSLFKIFDFKLIKGDPQTALREPFSIVLSEKSVKKYFGDQDPMGQSLLVTGEAHPAVVTGIMKDIPENSHIKSDIFLSMTTIVKQWNSDMDKQWGNYGA